MTTIEKIRDSEPDVDSAQAAGESVLVRLAVRLYSLRTAANLTQAELAELSGVDQANISDIETGDANPTARTIGRLAAGLGVNAGALLDHNRIGTRYGSRIHLREGVAWEGTIRVTASTGTGGSSSNRWAKVSGKAGAKGDTKIQLEEKVG